MRTCGAAFGPQLRSKLRAIGVGHMLVQLDNATEPKARQRYAAETFGLGVVAGESDAIMMSVVPTFPLPAVRYRCGGPMWYSTCETGREMHRESRT